MVLWQ